jgi:hypothetical protein
MTECRVYENPTEGHDGEGCLKRPVWRVRRRFLIHIGVVLFLGLGGFAVVRQLTHVPPSPDGRYGWTLYFPGPSPGAAFKTAPGDDIRRLLDLLLVDSGADWHGVLKETGAIRVALSHVTPAPLGVQLLWRFWGPQGSPVPENIGQTLLAVQVRATSNERPRYEIVRLGPHGTETVIGAFDEYEGAQDAVLDDLAEVMETVQAKSTSWWNG